MNTLGDKLETVSVTSGRRFEIHGAGSLLEKVSFKRNFFFGGEEEGLLGIIFEQFFLVISGIKLRPYQWHFRTMPNTYFK